MKQRKEEEKREWSTTTRDEGQQRGSVKKQWTTWECEGLHVRCHVSRMSREHCDQLITCVRREGGWDEVLVMRYEGHVSVSLQKNIRLRKKK